MNRSLSGLSSLAIFAASVSAGGTQAQSGDPWKEHCYPKFWEHVTALSGSNARDCGFFDLQSPAEEKERVRTCARQAESQSGAFKFGHLTYGIDSAFCTVAVRDDAGNYWSLIFDFDVNGGAGGRPSPALWLSKCRSLRFRSGDADRFFDLQRCEEAPDVKRRLIDGAGRDESQ